MFDNLKAHFIENILVLYKDYQRIKRTLKLGSSNDLRSATILSSALYHFREHIPIEIRKNRNNYIELCSDYKLIEDVANASKHATLTRHNPLLSNAEDIYEEVVSTEYEDVLGSYQHIEKRVMIKLNDGNERILDEVIFNVLNMWVRELNENGILDNFKLKKNSNRIPRRNKNSGKLNLQAMQNLRFGARFRMQKYNYEKKLIEPVDLTGAGITMRVYKPIYTFTLTLEKEGEKIIFDINLDDKEYKQFEKLKTEEGKTEFIIEKAKKLGYVK